MSVVLHSGAVCAEAPIELVHLGFRDGRLAVGYTEDQNAELYLIDFTTLSVAPLVVGEGADANPRWSNDGKRLAFDSDRGGKAGIYLKSFSEPGAPERLLVALEGAQQPDWSPDDAYLVFNARNKTGSGRSLHTVNTVDGRHRLLHESRDSATSPRWSPRGTEIVFSSNNSWPGWDLMLLDVNNLKVSTLSKGVQNYVRPTWHPDGGSVLFSYGSAREFDLWKIEKGSTDTKELVAIAGREFDAEWIQGGSIVFFVAEDSPGSGRYELFMHDFRTKQLSQITKSRGSIRGITWSPFPLPPVLPVLRSEEGADNKERLE